MVISDERKREVRHWARRRAQRKALAARRINELHQLGWTYEKIQIERGMLKGEFDRAKEWLFEALAQTSDHVGLEEALAGVADRQVELVIRFGELWQQRAGEREIREHLGLSEGEYDHARSWWLDGLAVTQDLLDDE